MPNLGRVASSVRHSKTTTSVRLKRYNGVSRGDVYKIAPMNTYANFGLCSPAFMHKLHGSRLPRVTGGCNHTIGLTHRTNFSTIRVRTKRNCLVDRFLSPCAGHHGSRFNNSLRGHVHFVSVYVRRIVGTTNGSVTMLIGVGVHSNFGNNVRVSRTLRITGHLRRLKTRTLMLDNKFMDGTPVCIVHNTVPVGAVARCVGY